MSVGVGIPVWGWVGEREREMGVEGGREGDKEDGCPGKMTAR